MNGFGTLNGFVNLVAWCLPNPVLSEVPQQEWRWAGPKGPEPISGSPLHKAACTSPMHPGHLCASDRTAT